MAKKYLSDAGLALLTQKIRAVFCGYAVCSTAAATAAKTVTLSNFKLVTGAAIKVKFTISNTAASPTLNVNSTGAKAIYYKGAAIPAGYLIANGVSEFVYNGAQYELVGAGIAVRLENSRAIDGVNFNGDTAISHYAVCSTAAGTAAKTAGITGFTLVTGARATIKFTNTNTAAAPTLNIAGTGAKDMYFKGAKITNEAPTLQANTIYDFIYTGSYYELIGNIAYGYGF